MWTILDAAEFLDSWIHLWHLTIGETMVTLLSILYKVYIDFSIKILGKLFVNDKQILTMSQIIFNPFLVIRRAHAYLKLQVCLSMYDLLLLQGIKGLCCFP